MKPRSAAKEELIRLVGPVIMRVAAACDGVGAGIAAYACLSMAVVAWRKTGLSKEKFLVLVDEMMRNDASKDPN